MDGHFLKFYKKILIEQKKLIYNMQNTNFNQTILNFDFLAILQLL